jgi:hypothetical protein
VKCVVRLFIEVVGALWERLLKAIMFIAVVYKSL